MKIAIYARTQDDNQHSDAALQSQIERCAQAAARYDGTPAIYTDRASGLTHENRPGLLHLEQDRPDMIIVTSLSRLARDIRQMNDILKILSETGAFILAVNEDICFPAAPVRGLM